MYGSLHVSARVIRSRAETLGVRQEVEQDPKHIRTVCGQDLVLSHLRMLQLRGLNGWLRLFADQCCETHLFLEDDSDCREHVWLHSAPVRLH